MQNTVLIVGAASGIAKELIALLLGRNYVVFCTVLNESEEQLISNMFPSISAISILDLADVDASARSLDQLIESISGSLDGVIVLAAAVSPSAMEMADLTEYRRCLEVNNVAALMVYQRCMPSLRQSKGWIAYTSSEAGKVALPYLGIYVSCKHALEGLCDVMRQEAAQFDVDVVIFEPGGIRTGLLDRLHSSVMETINSSDNELIDLYREELKTFANFIESNINTGMEPDYVAKVMLDTLESTPRDTRCVIGDDAVNLLGLRTQLPDREMDAVFKSAYSSAGKDQS